MWTLRALAVPAAALALLAGAASPAAAEPTAAPTAPARLAGGTVVAPGAPPLPSGLTATAWVVADLDSGEVLAAHDAHRRLAPASTLKVLTALALLPELPPASSVVPTQSEVGVEGSKVGLLRGVPYPAEELYQSLIMVSGNDAANALAGAVGGQAAAARLMNAEAARLGAVDTRAVNPHGLDAPGQVSTPYDLAVVLRQALQQPDIARWATLRRSTVSAGPGAPRFEIYNRNKLLGTYDGALGGKNGYTSRALASYVGAAQRGERRLVVAVMRTTPRFWPEVTALLDWGFAAAAAGVAPVGSLPSPPAEAEPAPAEATPTRALAAGDEGAGLPALPVRQLAGGALVAAAFVAVRPRRRLLPG